MSTQVYYIAAIAKEKLLTEAGCKDHDLRRIVHHSQLYDTLLSQYYEEEDRLEEEKIQREEMARASSKYCKRLDPISENGDDHTRFTVLPPVDYAMEVEKDFRLGSSEGKTTISVREIDDSEP